MKRSLPIHWPRVLLQSAALLFLLLFCLNFLLSPARGRDEGYLYVYALDVGQSEATLVTTGDFVMLVDCGSATERAALLYELARYGIERIDVLFLTHPHEDHVGNARYLLEYMAVGQVLLPEASSEESAWVLLQTALDGRATRLHTGYTFPLGGAVCEVLSVGNATGQEAENEASAVLRMVFGTQVFLFMGDAGAKTEAALLDSYGAAYLDCDFVKIGHHGSDGSTTTEFLWAATPAAVSISCGKDNSFGFPHARVLNDLNALGVHIARTDLDGTVVFGTNGLELRRIYETKGGFGR